MLKFRKCLFSLNSKTYSVYPSTKLKKQKILIIPRAPMGVKNGLLH